MSAEPYNLLKTVTDYFATVTPAQLEADMKAADFDHWNSVGEDIVDPESIRGLTLTRDSSTVPPLS
jgi:hypothetical protein